MQELYPPAPATLPPGLVAATPAYRRHAWLAVGGLAAFLALYLGLTVWFGYKAVWLFRTAWASGSFWTWCAAIIAGFFTIFLAKALFFIRHGKDESLLELRQCEEPALLAFVNRVADDARAPRPHRIFLAPDVNAAVFYDLTLLNLLIPSRKNLVVGLGLVNVLTLAELKAVLAHEFGHFAQRSMAVGRWVYTAQQIAAHVIGKRDVLDRFLEGISYFDIRIAWVGWALRLVVWSIRAVTDTFFRIVVLAERALSREMEFQADKVAVSLTGSDALIHALFKLPQADDAWDHVRSIAGEQLQQGKKVPDLYALQTRVAEQLRRVIGTEAYRDVPPLPGDGRAEHRIFTPDLAQPPAMWASHPPNHERERSAKQPYVEGSLDDRPAWLVFGDPAAARARMSAHLLDDVEGELLTEEEARVVADARFTKSYLEPRYHGLYLGRRVTRNAARWSDLYGEVPTDPAKIRSALADPYPSSVAEAVRRARDLRGEKGQLEALARGVADAPGGVIHHRGRTLRRRQLGAVIEAVEGEMAEVKRQLVDFDRHVRTMHLAAARAQGRGWPEYLQGLLGLLHFAEHNEDNVDDAMGHLENVTDVVTADGRVTGSEVRRLVRSGTDLQQALAEVWATRGAVVLPAAVAERMEIATWAEALGDSFELPPPHSETIGEWMDVVGSWHAGYSMPLGELRLATLETLLDAEVHVAASYLGGHDCGDAPPAPTVPGHYRVFLDGQERERQTKLDWWDRFVTADGFVPGLARLAVSGSIVGLVIGVGGSIGGATVTVYNGLGRPVVVSVGGEVVELAAWGDHDRVSFRVDPGLRVEARTVDGEVIESFEPVVTDESFDYVYSVAAAAALWEWTATYGHALDRDPVKRGAKRWFVTSADDVFTEPPETVGSSYATRTVLAAVDGRNAVEIPLVLAAADEDERGPLLLAHGRWDPLPGATIWLRYAADVQGVAEVLDARLSEAPDDVGLRRLEQDLGPDDACTGEPGTYLGIRCMPDGDAQNQAFIDAYAAHPDDPWLAFGAGLSRFKRNELREAIAAIAYARETLGWVAGDLALAEARMRRLAGDAAREVSSLSPQSLELQFLLDPGGAYEKLADGDLTGALAMGGDEAPRVLRLAAASDCAPMEIRLKARDLPDDAGLDLDTAVATLGRVRAGGGDDIRVVAFIEDHFRDHAKPVLRFADGDAGLDDELQRLPPEFRGHALVLGAITLGDRAPPQWRADAMRLLFPSERPWLGECGD